MSELSTRVFIIRSPSLVLSVSLSPLTLTLTLTLTLLLLPLLISRTRTQTLLLLSSRYCLVLLLLLLQLLAPSLLLSTVYLRLDFGGAARVHILHSTEQRLLVITLAVGCRRAQEYELPDSKPGHDGEKEARVVCHHQ